MPLDPTGRDAALTLLFLQSEWNEALSAGIRAPTTIYHYTTAEGLAGILKEGALRATNFSFLNDPSEVQYGKEFALRFLETSDDSPRGPYTDLINQIRLALEAKVVSESYVACFSALVDDLSQWRAYGMAATERYCIGFDGATIAKIFNTQPGGRFARILYNPKTQRQLLNSILARSWQFLVKNKIAAEGWSEVANTVATVIASRLPELKTLHTSTRWSGA